ncbi:MAG: Uma2 family endonuclease [Gemmatimonadaceae bacterium]
MPATIPRYTVDDLEHFPRDGNRYELVDGILLVTPPPGVGHEVVISRLAAILMPAAQVPGHAYVFTHGAVRLPPGAQLEPDLLVVPSSSASAVEWQDMQDHWLVVEVLSRSSRISDRDFKRDEYLRLGAREVWLVDRYDNSIDVSRARGESDTVRDELLWRAPTLDLDVRVDLAELFAGLA